MQRLLKPLFPVILILAALCLPQLAAAQTLAITNGVQTYSSLSNTVVTMTGRSELRVTGTNNPLFGSTINLNSPDAWFVLPNIRPSSVTAGQLSHVLVNGAAAVAGSNCRVDQYVMGSVIIPHSPGFTPLQIFSGPNFVGTSAQLGLYTYYTSNLGALNRNIGSFKLKRGYMATFAQNTDGTGASEVFVAQDGDLEIGLLAGSLNRPVGFVRVFPWRWTAKRGWDDTGGLGGDGAVMKPYWFYDWGNGRTSSTDAEYAPMKWTGGSGTSSINSKQNSTELLAYNEPDSTAQANMSVAAALADWPNLMQWGLRAGAPAVSDSGVTGEGADWIHSFITQATNLGYRVDFVPIHWYKCGQSASQLTNYLAGISQQAGGRPVWLTEFNYGANWCDSASSLPPTPAAEATAVSQFIAALENAPFVERYSIYEWVTTNRQMVVNGVITPAGVLYRDTPSTISHAQTMAAEGSRGIAQFQFETNTFDSSGYGNNGLAVGLPSYTDGHTGQALTFDGVNSYVQLPSTIAKTNAFSFAGWIYWNGGANWQRIFDFGDDTLHYMFLSPSSGGGTLRFAIKNGGSEQLLDAPILPVGQWVHVAVTLSSGSAKIYTNGTLAASSAAITITPANFIPAKNYLGKSTFAADPMFNGSLDEVQIADYVFTAAQIASLQTNSAPQFSTNYFNLGTAVPFLAFNTNVTDTASDPDPGDALTYSKATGPAWLTVSANGTITGTPGSADGGTNYFTIRTTDLAGASALTVASVVVPITYASGTWITANADGDWDDGTNWSAGVIPNSGNGGNFTADFSTLNISANRSVSLDTPRLIGNLKFGDTAGSQNWLVTSSNGSKLTLDTGSTAQPTIVVNQNTATIATSLAGAIGFAKSGAGTLILSNANSLGGILYIDSSIASAEGSVRAAYPGSLNSVTNIQIRNNNAGSSTFQLDGSAGNITVPARFNVSCRSGSVATIENISGTNTLSGFIALDVGGNLFNIQSDAGLLIMSGTNQYGGSLTGGRTYVFTGPGDHLVSGPILAGANGAPIGLTKSGFGTLSLNATNTYTNTTTVSVGKLLVNGWLSTGAVTVASSATLGGRGLIRGLVTVQAGGTLAPGTNATSIGTLTVSNSVLLQASAITRMKITKLPTTTNDVLRVAGTGSTLTYAGALVVTNLGGTLAAGDSFKLFNAVNYANGFTTFSLPPLGTGLAWKTDALNTGVISIIATLPPQFVDATQAGDGNFQFSGTGSAGVAYELDATTNLFSPIVWLFITNTVADQNGLYQLWDLEATNYPSRFYRITGSQ